MVNEPALSTRALSSVLYQVEGALTKSRNNLTRDAADKAWDRHSVTAVGDQNAKGWAGSPLASGHYFSQHRADFSVDDDVRPAIHVGRLAVNNRERGAVRLCDHR